MHCERRSSWEVGLSRHRLLCGYYSLAHRLRQSCREDESLRSWPHRSFGEKFGQLLSPWRHHGCVGAELGRQRRREALRPGGESFCLTFENLPSRLKSVNSLIYLLIIFNLHNSPRALKWICCCSVVTVLSTCCIHVVCLPIVGQLWPKLRYRCARDF